MGSKHDEKARPLSPEKGSLSVWTPDRVKQELADRGTSLSQLARDHGYSDAYLRNALVRPLLAGEQIIAAALGVDAKDIWPDRYNENGKPDYREFTLRRRMKAVLLAKSLNRSAA